MRTRQVRLFYGRDELLVLGPLPRGILLPRGELEVRGWYSRRFFRPTDTVHHHLQQDTLHAPRLGDPSGNSCTVVFVLKILMHAVRQHVGVHAHIDTQCSHTQKVVTGRISLPYRW